MAHILFQFSMVSVFLCMAGVVMGTGANDDCPFLAGFKSGLDYQYSIPDLAHICSLFKYWCIFLE